MPTRATNPRFRRLLAVLTVVAAFAFQMRVGGTPDLPPPGTPHAAQLPGHRMAWMPAGPAAAVPQAPSPDGHGEGERHNHGAHCPFCVTGAFALQADVLPLPSGPPCLASQALPFAPAQLPAAPRHADARAPPAALLKKPTISPFFRGEPDPCKNF